MPSMDPASLLLFVWQLCLDPPASAPSSIRPAYAAWVAGDRGAAGQGPFLRMSATTRRRGAGSPVLPQPALGISSSVRVSWARPLYVATCALPPGTLPAVASGTPDASVRTSGRTWDLLVRPVSGDIGIGPGPGTATGTGLGAPLRFGPLDADLRLTPATPQRLASFSGTEIIASVPPDLLRARPLFRPLPLPMAEQFEGGGGPAIGLTTPPIVLSLPRKFVVALWRNNQRPDLIAGPVLRPIRTAGPQLPPGIGRVEELLRIRRFNQENYIFAMNAEDLKPHSFWERLRGDRNKPSNYRQMRGPGSHFSVGSFDLPQQDRGIVAALMPWGTVRRLDNKDNPADLVYMFGNTSYYGFFYSYEVEDTAVGFEFSAGIENRGVDKLTAISNEMRKLPAAQVAAYGRF